MFVNTVTVNVPHPLYERLAERAGQTRRSVEDELLDALAASFSDAEDSPPVALENALASLDTVQDETLWRLARTSKFSVAATAHLEGLIINVGVRARRQRNSASRTLHGSNLSAPWSCGRRWPGVIRIVDMTSARF